MIFIVAVFVQILFLGATNSFGSCLMGSHNMRIASINVDDLSNPAMRSRVIAKIKKDKTQVIFYKRHMLKQENDKLKLKKRSSYADFPPFNYGIERGHL